MILLQTVMADYRIAVVNSRFWMAGIEPQACHFAEEQLFVRHCVAG